MVVVSAATTTAATAVVPARRMVVIGIVAGTGLRGGDDLGEQGLVLQLVEEAAARIAAGGLPAAEHRTGVLVELAVDLGVEAEAVEPALHVAALALVEADLVFGDLLGFLGEGGGRDAGKFTGVRVVAGGVAGDLGIIPLGVARVLQRGEPR